MRKSKQVICIILAALTIISAPLTSYMEAQAGELILELSLLDQLLIMFGINAGLGEQYDYFKRQDELKGLFEAASEGGTAELSGYGTVNFSETQSLKEWFEWSLDCQKFLLGNLSVINPENASRYMEVGKALDEVSYKNSGTCATNALNDNISDVYEEYKADPHKVLEEIQEAAKIICSPDTEITDITDAEARAEFNRKFWGTFCAIAAAGMLGVGNAAVPYAVLKMYSNSEFNEYDAVFGDAYFDGSYTMNADGQYVYSVSSPEIRSVPGTSPIEYVNASMYGTSSGKVVAYHSGSMYLFVCLNSSKTSLLSVSLPFVDNRLRSASGIEDSASLNFPLYPDAASALAALRNDNFSDAENITSYSYEDFKSNTGTAGTVIGNPLSGYVASLKSLTNLIDIIPEVREASDTYGGTAEMLPEIARILSEAGDIAVDNPDADDPNSSSNYSGILAKILAAINRLPTAILSALAGKFMTAERLETLLNGIPVVLAGVLSDAFSDSQISILPGILSDALSAVFPDAASVFETLADLPAYIISAVSGIQVKVPDITIPEIKVPEVTVPDVYVEAPSVTVPDVFVEAPVVTLNPTFDVMVANDYAELDNVISKAVRGVMTDVFVPSETDTLEKVGEMQEYFKFTEDMEEIISEFEKSVFGITPSPILKIPIGKSKSKKYNFGTGSYIIIDVSWYAEYKDFGDKIILAFAWAFFIWRIFVLLPGIISGGVGGFFQIKDVYTDFAIEKAYRNYDTLHNDFTKKK